MTFRFIIRALASRGRAGRSRLILKEKLTSGSSPTTARERKGPRGYVYPT